MLILEIHERVADLVLVGQLQAVKRTRRSVAITSGQSCHRQRGGGGRSTTAQCLASLASPSNR